MSEELDDLIAEPRTVPAGGREIPVRPLSPRQLPAFVAAVRPLQAALGGLALNDLQGERLLDLVERHTDHVIQAVAIATRQPEAFIGDEIGLDALVVLAAAVIEVNADFFARRVAPEMIGAMARLASLRAGPTPSSGS
ncbi:MAG TPA: hypothetical protein PK725_12535 [Rhodocyclaceae bacterium]|nr:hypothetical protein [Rhodocyclaceae bacterium]